MWHQWFNRNVMKLREYFLYAKKKKDYSTIRLLCVSVAPFWRISAGRKLCTLFCVSCTTRRCCFCSNQSVNKRRRRIRVARLTQNSIHYLRPANTLQNGTTLEETNCWIKSLFLFSLCTKYSRRFIKFRLNHWLQMDYFGDVFHTFLGLDSVYYLAVNGTVTSLPVFIQNILNCVPKTNEAFSGLERHYVINVKIFILGWSNPLKGWLTGFFLGLIVFMGCSLTCVYASFF